GPGSRRIEDNAADMRYQGTWTESLGNFPGGSIRWTATPGSQVQCSYSMPGDHLLFLGTRRADGGSQITVQVDANPPVPVDLNLPAEDVLVRVPLGQMSGHTQHRVIITHTGATGAHFYFDFLEAVAP